MASLNISPLDKFIQAVDLETNLLPFLRYAGWEQADLANTHWLVLHGERDARNHPLELVFPLDKHSPDRRAYIHKAVELLAALRAEPLPGVVQSIINYDRDQLYVRNLETDTENTLPLNLAVDQISDLRRTIEFAACSEREAKPFFLTPTPIAKRVVRAFSFGHTFPGSFGFTLHTPPLPAPLKFTQANLFTEADYAPPPVNVPLERRVMERLARGLQFAKQAEQERHHQLLVQEYASGLNANMCAALVSLARGKSAAVEFRLAWSPKIKPGEDVAQIKPIRFLKGGCDILEYAAKALKSQKPDVVDVIGHVRALTSSDNPLSSETRRAVVIRGLYPGVKRALDIVVELERDDYAKANRAHIEWQTVQVSGIISRSGTAWRLLNVKDFQVLR